MFRSLILLLTLTLGTGLLTLGCSQDQSTKTDGTESAVETQAPAPSEPQTPETQDAAESTTPEMQNEVSAEEQKQKALEQRKQNIDQLKSDGLILDVTTEGTVTKVSVDDKFHDQKKRKQKLIIKNLYLYYKAENPEMKELVVYDKNTDAEIAKVGIEGFSWKYDDAKKEKTGGNKTDEKAQ